MPRASQTVISWAHYPSTTTPALSLEDQRSIVENSLPIEKMISKHGYNSGPIHHIEPFKHSVKSLHFKTKGGVDVATKQRAILRSSTSNFCCKVKHETQVLKSVVVNSCIAWWLFERCDLLQSLQSYKNLDFFRNTLDKVQSTADFMILHWQIDLRSRFMKLRETFKAQRPNFCVGQSFQLILNQNSGRDSEEKEERSECIIQFR